MANRLDYEASCRRLNLVPAPPVPKHKPHCDDEEPLGVQFFRTLVEGDHSGLTLPRTYFGRSEIKNASFFNTDLQESNLCWNDFTDVDFGESDLSQSDLRASMFENVSFSRSNLEGADLRRSDFINCRFDGASMKGAILSRRLGKAVSLSLLQRMAISWTDDDGDEPDGG
ncbi:MAG: pentapeptide repeat-containing protein [Hyphomonadaceae bacterium]|nr:pentapeptide repeat-containing protein [Hyphomonadaceae bacterium]